MSETPKQRIRKILDGLPLNDAMRRAFEEALEQISEEECEEGLWIFDRMHEDNPDLLEDIIEAIAQERDNEGS